jgi:hypothetical protein
MPHYWVRIPSTEGTGDADVAGHMQVSPDEIADALQRREREIANTVFDAGGGFERLYVTDEAEYVLVHARPKLDIDYIVERLGADPEPLSLDDIDERIARGG